MGARQVADAHQELADDLAAGEHELATEQLHPLRLGSRMVVLEPRGERAVGVAEPANPAGVLDHRLDLEPVANDPGIGEKPRLVPRAKARHPVERESAKRGAKGFPLFEHGQPRQARLVDFERQALEESRFIVKRETVFGVVIRPVEGMPGRDRAIGRHRYPAMSRNEMRSEVMIR